MPKDKMNEIKLPSLDELFSSQKERDEADLKKIYEIPLSEIDPFPDHPFGVRDDEDMMHLVDSIKVRGVLTPATVRQKDDGRYELLSGHRRMRACELAGIDKLRCEVVDMSRDEATIFMVESNFQRTTILPSEKAFAYKMKMEAFKSQGKRTDLTSYQVGTKFDAAQEVAKGSKDSRVQVFRYIRLTNLIPKLLDLVDKGSIALTTAVELSYLKPHEQEWVQDAIEYEECTPSLSQAGRLKKASQERTLTKEDVLFLMQEKKPNQRAVIKIARSELGRYFPKDYTDEQIKTEIMKSLDNQRRERLRRERDSR